MGDKKVIVVHLKLLLMAGRAGSAIDELMRHEKQDKMPILLKDRGYKES